MASKRRRLSRSGEFDRVYRDGSSTATRYLVLYTFPRKDEEREEVRLGVSVNRKVGGAVDRNKVKRALREAFCGLSDRLPPKHDFVIVARAEIKDLVERDGMAGVTANLEEALAGGRSTWNVSSSPRSGATSAGSRRPFPGAAATSRPALHTQS